MTHPLLVCQSLFLRNKVNRVLITGGSLNTSISLVYLSGCSDSDSKEFGVLGGHKLIKDQVNGGGGGPVTQGQSDLRGKGSPQSAEQSLLQPRPPGMPGPLPQALQVSKPLAFAGVES